MKTVICRIQHADNKVQHNGLTKCTAAMWSCFWCQEEHGAGRGARSQAGAGAQLQGFTTAPSSSCQGMPWHPPLLPFVPWLLCGKSGRAGQGKARKHSCHILVRPKNCRLHCTDMYSPGSAAAPGLHLDPDKNLIQTGHFFMDTSKPGRHCWNSTLLYVCNDLKTPGFSGVLLLLLWITHQMVTIKILQMMNSAWIPDITLKVGFSEFALWKCSLGRVVFCCWFSSPVYKAPHLQAAFWIITSTFEVWMLLPAHTGHFHCFLCLQTEIHWKINVRFSIWS